MNKSLTWRFVLIGLVLAGALYFALPLEKKIKLGLDLQGGMHLVYEVQVEKAVESAMARTSEDLKTALAKGGVATGPVVTEGEKITIDLLKQEDAEPARKAARAFGELEESGSSGLKLAFALTKQKADSIRQHSVDQALETLRNRIDQFGVSEPIIQRHGENRILIQLAGVQNPDRAKAIIQTTARLEFRLVDDNASVENALKGQVPENLELLYEYRKDETGKSSTAIPLLVEKNTLMGGDSIADAEVKIDQQYNEPFVSLGFDSEGARRFGEITGKYVKRRLAIVLDGKVYSAPVIREKIAGGNAQITGSFTADQAHDLAIVLRAGALPAPLVMAEERSIGPSLGADSIKDGIKACIYGALAVVVFMLVYYRVGGLIADAALILNMIILAGLMGWLGATLTLPGIAGIALTIGIAVDANVLIYERIREELTNGKTIRSAVDAGFKRAFVTIMDSNITTLIAAVVLFQFGTGPLKGFAVTLSIGILASLFSAVFVSRTVFDLILTNRKITGISV
jgi:preprotein translocase subunit SecD